jgi:hypothetical protein
MKSGRAAIPKHVSRPDVLGLLLQWLAESNQLWLAWPPSLLRLNSRVLKRAACLSQPQWCAARDTAIGRSSIRFQSVSASSMGRTHRRSSAHGKSPGRHTNRPARDVALVPIRSARANDSRAGSHSRATDAPRAAFQARAPQTLQRPRTAKPRGRSEREDFVPSPNPVIQPIATQPPQAFGESCSRFLRLGW